MLKKMLDMHFHGREGPLMEFILPFMPAWCRGAVIMPNLETYVANGRDVRRYRTELLRTGTPLRLFMTIALTDDTTVEDVEGAARAGIIGVKVYFKGTTTHSKRGIRSLRNHVHIFEAMERLGLVCLIHGELPDASIFTAEREFHPELLWLVGAFPGLRVVFEHISMKESADLVESLPDTVAATITAVHLLLTAEDWAGQVWNYCKPVAKWAVDRDALRKKATSGTRKFFFGSDSAAHWPEQKYQPKALPGVFSAPVVPAVLASVFEEMDALDHLKWFTSDAPEQFYQLPPETAPEHMTLVRQPWIVPSAYGRLVPLCAGQELPWQVEAAA